MKVVRLVISEFFSL